MPRISALPPGAQVASTDAFPFLSRLTNTTERVSFDTLQSAVANAGVVQSLILQNLQSSIAQPVSATNVNFTAAAAGAVPRSIQSKARDAVCVLDFMTSAQITDVESGAPILDHTVAVQLALTSSLCLKFSAGSSPSYRVSSALLCQSGHDLYGEGATITEISSNTEIFNIEGKSDFRCRGFNFVGNGNDYQGNDSSRAVAIFGSTGSRISVFDNKFTNFTYTTLRTAGANTVSFTRNIVTGPGASVATGFCYGILYDAGTTNGIIANNFITAVGQGIRVEQCTNTQIVGNVIYDVSGQHGVYSGSGMTNTTISNNVISNMPLCGIKHQAADAATKDNTGVTIVGNTIITCGDQGILLLNGNPGVGGTFKVRGATISGNFVKSCASSGINVSATFGASITGNVVDTPGFSGINIDGCQEIVVDSNVIRKSVLSAIRDQNPSTKITITNNQITDCASAATPGDRDGILVQDGTTWTIERNVIRDANAKMEYGIIILAGTLTGAIVRDNTVPNATATGGRFPANTTFLTYSGNNFSGTLGSVTNYPVICTRVFGSYSVQQNDSFIIANTAAAPLTLLLETSPADGHVLNIKKSTTDANVMTVARNGSRIDGFTSDLATSATNRPNYRLEFDMGSTCWWLQ